MAPKSTPPDSDTTPIDTLADTLNIDNSTQQVAQVIFNKTTNQRNGRSLTIIASAAVYLACKQNNQPTNADTIAAELDRYSSNQLLQMAKQLDSELSLGTNLFNPTTYITEYTEQLNLSDDATELAHQISTITTDEGVASGRSPTGFAAAAVYYASILANEKRTQKEVSTVANVSQVTIRNTYHDQADCLGDRLNKVL